MNYSWEFEPLTQEEKIRFCCDIITGPLKDLRTDIKVMSLGIHRRIGFRGVEYRLDHHTWYKDMNGACHYAWGWIP